MPTDSIMEFQGRRAVDLMEELCKTKHTGIEDRLVKLELSITKIANRPPVWATIAMTIMGTVIGNLIGRA